MLLDWQVRNDSGHCIVPIMLLSSPKKWTLTLSDSRNSHCVLSTRDLHLTSYEALSLTAYLFPSLPFPICSALVHSLSHPPCRYPTLPVAIPPSLSFPLSLPLLTTSTLIRAQSMHSECLINTAAAAYHRLASVDRRLGYPGPGPARALTPTVTLLCSALLSLTYITVLGEYRLSGFIPPRTQTTSNKAIFSYRCIYTTTIVKPWCDVTSTTL